MKHKDDGMVYFGMLRENKDKYSGKWMLINHSSGPYVGRIKRVDEDGCAFLDLFERLDNDGKGDFYRIDSGEYEIPGFDKCPRRDISIEQIVLWCNNQNKKLGRMDKVISPASIAVYCSNL